MYICIIHEGNKIIQLFQSDIIKKEGKVLLFRRINKININKIASDL